MEGVIVGLIGSVALSVGLALAVGTVVTLWKCSKEDENDATS